MFQVVFLLGFGLLVLAVLVCDARQYRGVDLYGQPIYPENHPFQLNVHEASIDLNSRGESAVEAQG